jgi:hypothetical protein
VGKLKRGVVKWKVSGWLPADRVSPHKTVGLRWVPIHLKLPKRSG